MSIISSAKTKAELKKKYEELLKELEEVDKEIEHVTQTKRERGSELLSSSFDEEDQFPTYDIVAQEMRENNRFKWYERLTGMHIKYINVEPIEVNEKKNKSGNIPYFKYDLSVNFEKLNMRVSYVSDKNYKIERDDENKCYEIRNLHIELAEKIHQNEIKTCLQYFSDNPSHIAWAFSCIHRYNMLFKEREDILNILTGDNPDYLRYTLISKEDDTYVELTAFSRQHSREYFKLYWYILWDQHFLRVKDKIRVEISYPDADFINSINHSFMKLCQKLDLAVKKIGTDMKVIRLNSELKKGEKLQCLRDVITAVKAADS